MGSVAQEQLQELTELLTGLAGCAPQPLQQHEVVLRAPAAAAAPDGAPPGWKPDLRLQHDLQPSSSGQDTAEESRRCGLRFACG